ncbi:MAG TPA: RNA-binding S4 domain-containing protein [Paracoccaceae bacterium]|nr:RNA-binding S4 domain-containing protein [Paracoccaceae bacterium]
MAAAPGIRIDKWLWHARFFRTRSLAARMVAAGGVRVNRVRVTKPAALVRPGDVLTIALPGMVRVVRMVAAGERRGPATEARALYAEIGGEGASPGEN